MNWVQHERFRIRIATLRDAEYHGHRGFATIGKWNTSPSNARSMKYMYGAFKINGVMDRRQKCSPDPDFCRIFYKIPYAPFRTSSTCILNNLNTGEALISDAFRSCHMQHFTIQIAQKNNC